MVDRFGVRLKSSKTAKTEWFITMDEAVEYRAWLCSEFLCGIDEYEIFQG